MEERPSEETYQEVMKQQSESIDRLIVAFDKLHDPIVDLIAEFKRLKVLSIKIAIIKAIFVLVVGIVVIWRVNAVADARTDAAVKNLATLLANQERILKACTEAK